MRKNSLLPLFLLLAVMLSLPLCIHQRDSKGYNGPSLFEGIYRGQEGRYIPVLPKSSVSVKNMVTSTVSILGKSPLIDYRQGLEGPSWDNILIYAEDDHAVTRSVVKALAELFTGMLKEDPYGFKMPFYLVHIQPHDKPLRPWGVSRILRVRTLHAVQHPEALTDDFSARVSLCMQDPRLPNRTRPFMPLTAGGVQEMGLTIEHTITSSVEKLEGFNWANWHATVGRSIAADAMRHCLNGETEELDWQQLAYDVAVGAWRAADEEKDGKLVPGKKTLLPVQPGHKVLTWLAGFQEPLARGWCGAIIGVERQSRMGTTTQTFNKWQEHLDGSGSWRQRQLPDDQLWLWEHGNKNPQHMHYVMTQQYDFGAEILTWQQFTDINVVFQTWLASAAGGSLDARILLRRYILCEQISPELRDEALSILRDRPDAAELALLGLHPKGNSTEQAVAQAIAFIRGMSDNAETAESLPDSDTHIKQWDRRPLFIKYKDTLAVLLYQRSARNGEQPRGQVWWRSVEASSQPRRTNIINGTALCGEMKVALEQADDLLFDIHITEP